ncbi:MAG TPA: carboxypeptidase regulatory-like domain-containing protein, partial [Polyangiaceae bacterium]|nr:carboxypeptidase regulatory-like domain-containing protein [Polyangiaceae bacterium]
MILALAAHGSPLRAQTPPPPAPAPPAPPAPAEGEEGGDEEMPEEPEKKPGAPAPGKAAPADDAEISDEELLEGEGDPNRPPPAGKGVIFGTVKETEFKEPLIEAPVQVVGTKTQAITDLEGRFRLELPPGTYNIRVSYELHKSARFDGVVVEAGKATRLDVDLIADKDAVDVFEVVEEADKSSLEGLVLARQKATVVGDSIGRSEISKTTDRNAAQA